MLNVLFSLSLQFINGIFHRLFLVLQEGCGCWGWVALSCLARGSSEDEEEEPIPSTACPGVWGAGHCHREQGATSLPPALGWHPGMAQCQALVALRASSVALSRSSLSPGQGRAGPCVGKSTGISQHVTCITCTVMGVCG